MIDDRMSTKSPVEAVRDALRRGDLAGASDVISTVERARRRQADFESEIRRIAREEVRAQLGLQDQRNVFVRLRDFLFGGRHA